MEYDSHDGACGIFFNIEFTAATIASVTATPRSPAIIGWHWPYIFIIRWWLVLNPISMVVGATITSPIAWLTVHSNWIDEFWILWYWSSHRCRWRWRWRWRWLLGWYNLDTLDGIATFVEKLRSDHLRVAAYYFDYHRVFLLNESLVSYFSCS